MSERGESGSQLEAVPLTICLRPLPLTRDHPHRTVLYDISRKWIFPAIFRPTESSLVPLRGHPRSSPLPPATSQILKDRRTLMKPLPLPLLQFPLSNVSFYVVSENFETSARFSTNKNSWEKKKKRKKESGWSEKFFPWYFTGVELFELVTNSDWRIDLYGRRNAIESFFAPIQRINQIESFIGFLLSFLFVSVLSSPFLSPMCGERIFFPPSLSLSLFYKIVDKIFLSFCTVVCSSNIDVHCSKYRDFSAYLSSYISFILLLLELVLEKKTWFLWARVTLEFTFMILWIDLPI